MGKRGPPPTPTKVLDMRGSWRADLRTGEPAEDKAEPVAPEFLTLDERAAWNALTARLRVMGLLSDTYDAVTMRLACLYVEWLELRKLCHKGRWQKSKDGKVSAMPWFKGMREVGAEITRLESLFGLSPSSKTSLIRGDSDGDLEDELDKYREKA